MKLSEFEYMVDDDFLPEGGVENIQNLLLHGDAEWVLGKELLGKGYRFKTNIDPYEGSQFNHLFFIDSKIYSPFWEQALAIVHGFCYKNGVRIHAVMRCKANLTFPDTSINPLDTETPHVDHHWPHFTLLYFVNDAVGPTVLYKEKFDPDNEVVLHELARVHPKAGRAVLFNGLNYHSPSVPAEGYRAVINFTFLGEFA